MEIALLIDTNEEYRGNFISDYNLIWGSDANGLKSICKKIDKIVSNKIDYIYFGNEFCEYRIPSVEQLSKMLDICNNNNLTCVLVTPVVTDFGINQIANLLDYLDQNVISLDIVVNDMGVLELIRQKGYLGKIIVGRILEKSSHDCRATKKELDEYYGENGMKFAKTPGVISVFSKKVFERYGVYRYEFDLSKVGIELPFNGNYSLYWPYSYLTTGRVCMFRSLDLNEMDKFLVGDKVCGRKCLQYKVEKRKPINGYSVDKAVDMFLFQKGNTLFFINEDVEDYLGYFNRLIIQL